MVIDIAARWPSWMTPRGTSGLTAGALYAQPLLLFGSRGILTPGVFMAEKEAIVFVVDDDESVRESLASLIRSAGLGGRNLCLSARVFGALTCRSAELSGIGCSTAGAERARPAKTDGGSQY